MTSPSRPWYTPRPSLKTAILAPGFRGSTTSPMYFKRDARRWWRWRRPLFDGVLQLRRPLRWRRRRWRRRRRLEPERIAIAGLRLRTFGIQRFEIDTAERLIGRGLRGISRRCAIGRVGGTRPSDGSNGPAGDGQHDQRNRGREPARAGVYGSIGSYVVVGRQAQVERQR